MTIKFIPVFLIIAFAWIACKNDAPQSASAPAESTPAETAPLASPGAASGAITTAPAPGAASGAITSPAPAAGSAVVATPQTAAPAVAAGSGKVNPPHGQPGHRCDIAVGAPLDGAAPAPANKSVAAPQPAAGAKSSKPTVTPVTMPAGNATVAPGTNPPHGQPGHRCDIAVGAPLDSKPKQ